MISDEDARQFFRSQLGKPCAYGGGNLSLQIFRGCIWEDVHPGSCTRHFKVFNTFKVIPESCFGCYKVIISPRNVVEHFKLLMVFAKQALPNDNTRKCMVETRDDCDGTYKGLVYCRGDKEGKEMLKVVQDMVAGQIASGIPIALKRGCSEFAAAYPAFSPSDPDAMWMEYNPSWKVHEEFVDNNSIFTRAAPPFQSGVKESYSSGDLDAYSPSEIFAMRYWLRYAATIGDTSYLKITDCPLPPLQELKRPPFTGV